MVQRPNRTEPASNTWPCFDEQGAYIKSTSNICKHGGAAMPEFAKRGDVFFIKPRGAGSARPALFLSSIGGVKAVSGSVKSERGL